MKTKLMIASLLAAHTTTPSVSLAQSIAQTTKTKVCALFEIQKKHNLISTFEAQLQDGSVFCAEILKTDDQKMLELVLHKKNKSGEITKYGGMAGDDVRLFLLPNPLSSYDKSNSYIGITCNSSEFCQTGETFIARIETDTQELYLSIGKYGISEGNNLNFIPEEIKNGLKLTKTK